MDLLNKEIRIDVGHLLLLAVVVLGVLFVANRCRLTCGLSSPLENLGVENLMIPKIHQNICRCPDCAETCYQRALNGQLPGCGGCNGTNYDQCNDSYRRCLLSGCAVASGNTCNCSGKA